MQSSCQRPVLFTGHSWRTDDSSSSDSVATSPSVLSRSSSQTSLSSAGSISRDKAEYDGQRTQSQPIREICFVGAGYVGGPTAAVTAYCNPDISVAVVDMNEDRIDQWNSKHLPFHEPGLEDMVRVSRDGAEAVNDKSSRAGNLTFSTNCNHYIATADIIFLSVNTPTKACGIGAGAATDISMFESATRAVALAAKPGAIVVEKSTVPCRTAEIVRDTLEFYRPGAGFEVLSNPEFLAEGTAIADLLQPSRVLIGSDQTESGLRAASRLASVYSWVPQESIVMVDTWSSELSKLVANAMLAQRISSINTVSAICERTGADVDSVARTIGLDPRLGSKFLKAGLGFGGSCFKKDILSLSYLAESLDLPEVGQYWRSVIGINEWQVGRFVKSVLKTLNGSLRGKKIAVLGYAFKQDTSDVRESQAAAVVRQLLEERAGDISIYDPQCRQADIEADLRLGELHAYGTCSSPVNIRSSAYEACADASAVLILTEWQQFSYPPTRHNECSTEGAHALVSPHWRNRPEPQCTQDCDKCALTSEAQSNSSCGSVKWETVAPLMRGPKWVFDARGVVADMGGLQALGFRVQAIGKASGSRR